jgi:hypothetical protein
VEPAPDLNAESGAIRYIISPGEQLVRIGCLNGNLDEIGYLGHWRNTPEKKAEPPAGTVPGNYSAR